MSAIGITLRRAEDGGDPGASRLFGAPSSLPDGGEKLLQQFDPLAADTGSLDETDGYAYFFFGADPRDIDGVRLFIDRSRGRKTGDAPLTNHRNCGKLLGGAC